MLRVSGIPDESPVELQRKFKALGEHLSDYLSMEVQYVPAPDYSATVKGLAEKNLDLVWFGGFTFVLARERTTDAIPLVQREQDTHFHTNFIAHAKTNIRSLTDLKGASFAFGSVASTSGHLMPRFFLSKAGVVPERDFAKLSFSGAHDATAQWVELGVVDAGAINESIWNKLIAEGRVDANQVRVFYQTPEFVDYVWTVRASLDPSIRDSIKRAFLSLDYANPKHRAILDLQQTKKFIEAEVGRYRAVEAAARQVGLIPKPRRPIIR